MVRKLIVCTLFFVACLAQTQAQNTLVYTEKDIHYRNGIELFERRAYAAAIQEFQGFLDRPKVLLKDEDFNRISAEYYQAVCAMYLGYPEAELQAERFVTAHATHPQAVRLFRELGLYYFNNEDYNKAVTYLEKTQVASLTANEALETRFKLGVAYYNLQNLAKALDVFSGIKNSNDEKYGYPASYYAGHINFRNENYEEAIDDFRRIENSNQYKNEVPGLIAQVYYRQNKFDEMLAYTEPLLSDKQNKAGRKLDDLALLTAEVYFQRADYKKAAQYYTQYANFKSAPVPPAVRYRYGYSLYRTNDFKRAIDNLKVSATGKDEIGQYSAYFLGITYLKNDAPNLSLAAFDQARKLDFNASVQEDAYLNYGKVLLDLNRGNEAIKALNDFLAKYPTSKYEDEANELISEAYLSSNDYPSAMKYIEGLPRRTSKINGAYQRMAYNQGVTFFNNEQFVECRKNFDKSISASQDPDLKTSAQFWKAESYSAERDYTQALPLYKQVQTTATDDALSTKSMYALGYCYYNTKDYANAQTQFKAYTEKLKGAKEKQNYDDAVARLADCYFVNKNYTEANRLYDQVLNNGTSDKDYAMYQKALSLEFQDKDGEAKTLYDKVVTQYPNSRYADDALLRMGMIDFNAGNYPVAIRFFNRLIQDKPKSPLMPQTLLKRAVAYTNIQSKEEAIKDYTLIINRFCDTKSAESAILGLQDLLNDVGRSEDYPDFLASYKKCNPGNGSLEAIEFESAKSLYFNEKYEKAIQSLLAYMQSYPGSSNNAEAKYFLGDSYFRTNDKAQALRYFYMVIGENRTSYVSRALSRAADIEMANKNYQKAATNYRSLVTLATDKKDVVRAWSGLMELYYQTAKYDSVLVFTREIIGAGSVNLGSMNKALLYQGRVYEAKGDAARAIEEYNKALNAAKDDIGADAKYSIANIYFKQKKFEESKKVCLEFAEQFPDNEKWRGKAFLLYADACVATGDVLQAKATLNSIIENSEDENIKTQAKEKLKGL